MRELDSDEETPIEPVIEDDKVIEEPTEAPIDKRLDLLDEMLNDKKEEKMEETKTEINIENENENENNNDLNIFNGFNEEEKYVTYHVYPFTENDTLEKVMEKYKVTKEELEKYNKLDNLHTGDKLIIPQSTDDK